jgi:hypothetical protein
MAVDDECMKIKIFMKESSLMEFARVKGRKSQWLVGSTLGTGFKMKCMGRGS